MAKKLHTFLLALALSLMPLGIAAQVYLNEDFNSPMSWQMTWDVSDNTPSGGFVQGWQNNTMGRSGSCVAVTFRTNQTLNAARLKSPSITIPSGKDLSLSFYVKNSATLNVYASTDGGVTYTPGNLLLTTASNNDFTRYEASLSAYKGQTIKLVFEGQKNLMSSFNTSIYLDDILVEALASCQFPENPYIEGLTTTSATLHWTLNTRSGSVPDSYQLRLFAEDGTLISSSDSVAAPGLSYTFTGLTANTTYTASVRSYCLGDGFADSATVQFTTIPNPVNPPFSENFDEMTSIPKGYFLTNADLNSTASFAYGNSGHSIRLSTTATDGAMIAFPPLNIAANDIQFSFYIRRGSNETSTNGAITYSAGYLTDPTDISTFVPVLTDQLKGDVSWHSQRFNTSNVQDVTTPVMPCIYLQNGYTNQAYIDNVYINNIPSCIRPENVTLHNVFDASAILTWNTSAAGNHNIYLTNLSDNTVDTLTAAQSPVTLTGLIPSTPYSVTVQAICTASDSSEISLPATFTTLCPPTSPVFHETFDQLVANAVPDCWQMGWDTQVIGSLFVNAPFSSSSSYTHASSAKSMSLVSQNNGSESYMVSRPLIFDAPGAYDLSVWVYRQNASARTTQGLQFWITNSPYDTTGGVMLDYIHHHYAFSPAEFAQGWYQYIYNIPVSGTKYLMIRGISEQSTATYFDDLEIMVAPTCRRVKDIVMDNVTSNSADIHWTGVNGESQWAVNYTVLAGTQPIVADTTVIVNTPNYTITGLASNTDYTIDGNVRAICQPGDTSMALDFSRSIVTECETISQLPYTTSFENEDRGRGTNPLPMCWTRFNDSSSGNANYPYNYSYAAKAKSGTMVLYFTCTNASNNPANEVAVLPGVNAALFPLNTLRIKFWGIKSAATQPDAKLLVGVMSDPADIETFIATDSVVIDSDVNRQYTALLTSYNGTGIYPAICFKRPATSTTFMIDDVLLEQVPECADLEGHATVDSITYSSARITIEDTTAIAGWSLAYGSADADFTTYTVIDTSGTSIVIDSLSSAMAYNIYLRRICGNKIGAWTTEPVTFTTAFRPAEMPYICGFENDEENRLWEYSYATATSNRFNIGSVSTAVFEGSKAMYVSNSNGTNYNYNTGVGGNNYAYRKMSFDAKGYQVVFHWKCTGGQANYDFGRVMLVPESSSITYTTSGVGPNTVFPDGAIFFDPEGKTNMSLTAGDITGWNTVSYYLDMTERPGIYNFALFWTSNTYSGSQYPLAIDGISITELSCIPPSHVNAVNITTSSATLSFPDADGTEWQVMVDSVPFTDKAVPATPMFLEATTSDTVTVSGLEPNHEYFYSIRSICGEGDTSAWRAVDMFRTNCTAFAVPYFEDFESPLSDKCWSIASSTGSTSSVSRNTAQHKEGNASLLVTAAMAVTPELLVDSLHKYYINGWVYSTTDSAVFSVGAMVDPEDQASFGPMGSVTVPIKNQWTPFSAYFTDLLDEDFVDIVDAKHIVLAANSNTLYFDDLSIDLIPSCANPTEVSVTNIGAHSFDISFRDNAQTTSWLVRFNDEYAVINSNPATVTGLEPSKMYDIHVAALCPSGDTSAFSYAGTVFSGCDAISLPWSTGFEKDENFPSTSWDEGILEKHCWVTYNASAGVPRYQMTATAYYVHTGNQCLYTFTNANAVLDKLYLILPEFDHPSNMLNVDFWYMNGGAQEGNAQLIVGYLTDANDTTTFVPLDSLERIASYTEYVLNTSLYPSIPANARIALVVYKHTNGQPLYIDDLTVSPIFSCAQPFAPVVGNIGYNSADIQFTDTCAQHTSWEYIYGTRGFNRNNATPVAINADNFALTGLAPDTEYDVYVRTVCGPGDYSAWVKAEFRTLCNPVSVSLATPFSDSFEEFDTNNQELAGCYRIEGNSGSYTIRSRTADMTRTGSVSLQVWGDPTFASRGLSAYRLFHFEAGHTYRASVWTRALNNLFQATLYYGLRQDIDSMNVLSTINIPGCTTSSAECWNELSGFISVPETGDYFVAFNGGLNQPNNSINVYFDDFEVREMEGCSPSTVTVDSVGLNSAYCSVADTSTENTYEYVIIEGLDTVTAPLSFTGGSFVVTGLQNSTEYTVAVRQNCGDGLYSPWTSATFSTMCGIRTLFPVSEGFEGQFPPACWSQFSYGEDVAVASWTRNTYSPDVHSGTYSATVTMALGGSNTALVTCAYDLNSPTGHILSFWMTRKETTQHKFDEALHVYYSSETVSPDNIASLNELGMVNSAFDLDPVEPASGYYKYEYFIPASVTGPVFFVFDFHDKQGLQISIDDIAIEVAPTCVAPLDAPVIVDYNMNSANITVDLNGHSEAEIAVSLASAPQDILGGSIVSQSLNTATNLLPSTHYVVRYRYICQPGDTSAWSDFTDFTTTATNCFEPVNIRTTGILDDHHAELTWGVVPDATGYGYELLQSGAVIASGNVTNNRVTFNSLTANTQYTFRVRTYCSGDTLGWRSVTFSTTYPTYTAPYICGFEDLTQNAGWHLYYDDINPLVFGTDQNAVRTGSRSVYVNGDGQSYSYLPGFSQSYAELVLNLGTGHYLVEYDWKNEGDSLHSYGRLFLMPSATDIRMLNFLNLRGNLPTGSVSVDGDAHLSGSSSWTHHRQIIEITDPEVFKLVIAFISNLSEPVEPGLAVDNISIVPITCLPVDGVRMISVNSTDARAVISRRESNVPVQYGFSHYDSPDSVTEWILINTNAETDTVDLVNLRADYDYYLFARHYCNAADQSPVEVATFHTPSNAVSLPYVCSFELTENLDSWTLTTGGATNAFTFGSAAASHGTQSLYVSDNGISHNYNTTSASWSYAFVPVVFGEGRFYVSYDWMGNGQNNNDYARIFLAPASTYPAGNTALAGVSSSSLPDGYMPLDGGSQLTLSSAWQNITSEFSIPDAGTYQFIVFWTNNNGGGLQPPFAIDNLNIGEITCPRIAADSVSTDSVAEDMIRLHVNGNDADAGIEYTVAYDSEFTDVVTSGILASGNEYIDINGLAAGSWYFVRLVSICDENDSSFATVIRVHTQCGVNSAFPYNEDFESFIAGQGERTQLSDNCWLTASTSEFAYHYVVTSATGSSGIGSSVAENIYGGEQALCIYNNVGSDNTQTLALPKVDDLNGKILSFWYRNGSTTTDVNNLYVGYLTDADSVNTFVQSAALGFSSSHTEFSHIFSGVPAGARPAIRAIGRGNVYIDDVRMNNIVNGDTFNDTICFDTPYNAHGFSKIQGSLAPGDHTFTRIVRSNTVDVSDSVITANVFMRDEIAVISYDTVCRYQPYVNGLFNIPNPHSQSYTQHGISVTGCDSSVILNLTVHETFTNLFDTICMGDSYAFHGQTLTVSGDYLHVEPNVYGCNDTVSLHLDVVDTLITFYETICAGQSFIFEGNRYTQSGTYNARTVGRHGCDLVKTLHLTVLATDTFVNVTICQGGEVQVADTFINQAGTYLLTRVNSEGCNLTYHITTTVAPAVMGHVTDSVCEGSPYTGYGINNLTVNVDTTVYVTTRTNDAKCDSIGEIFIHVIPTIRNDIYATIASDSIYEWNYQSFNQTGDYTDTLYSQSGCDSIVTLHLTVGVDDVQMLNISLVPNPVNAGQSAFVYGHFTDVRNVEVLNSFGQIIDTLSPDSYPIEVQGISVSGIYYIRITTGDGKVAVRKLIVK